MFYMLVNVHLQNIAVEELSPPHHFWYILLDLPYGI
jgi:hypothetical protein